MSVSRCAFVEKRKAGLQKEQRKEKISPNMAKRTSKKIIKRSRKNKHRKTEPEEDRELAIVKRLLKTGHYPKLIAYANKIGARPHNNSAGCDNGNCSGNICESCGKEAEDAKHVLIKCPAWSKIRFDLAIRTPED